jgi:hypothetical protein
MGERGASGSAWRIVRVCIVLAILHSALASKQVKELVARVAGPRHRNGLYRFAYILQSMACFFWLAWWVQRLPDRELYHVRAPWSWLLRAGQAASLAVGFGGVRVIGVQVFNGLPQLQAYLAGEVPAPEPEAQGPPRGADGQMVVAGSFRFTRHPGNLAPLGVILCFPRMTVNRLTLASVTAAYAIVGSLHEEYRLRAAYGDTYVHYSQEVPFLLPLPGRQKTLRRRNDGGSAEAQ